MEHAKRLCPINEFNREYKHVQRPSAAIVKARSAVRRDDILHSTELDDHEKACQYLVELHRYLNITTPPPLLPSRIFL